MMENELLFLYLLEIEDLLADEENGEQNRRQIIERADPFETLSDNLFKKVFRLTKPLVIFLMEILDPFLNGPTRTSALDKRSKVLIALHFYATGSYQLDIGYNIFSGVSQPTVSRCLSEVTEALNRPEIFNQWVHFPNSIAEINLLRRGFFEKYEFPGVIGVIDGTHVAIVPPNTDDPEHPEHIYINRKCYHSINTQLVCDSNMKILNINARFPGSANDLYILNHSNIKQVMESLSRQHHKQYLLGDSGYMLRSWLQIPIANPEPGSPQERYNTSFKIVRSIIERCIGLLKMRFRCLLKHRVLHYTPTKSSKIINACAVLHNLCIAYNVPIDLGLEERNDGYLNLGIFNEHNVVEARPERQNRDLRAGHVLQQQIVQNYFAN